jgi:anti-sigma-K factor RskA
MDERLDTYHDGELSGRARRRLERDLRRSPELQTELEALASLRAALRDLDAQGPEPDLWEEIALRLSAVDARRAAATEARAPSRFAFPGWLRPATALAAIAAVVVGIAAGLYWPAAPHAGRVVRWIDSGDRNVMVIDDDPSTTIIWVLDSVGDEASRGEGRELEVV